MKLVLLTILATIVTSTAFAQRGPRYNPPGGRTTHTTTVHHGGSHSTTTVHHHSSGRTTVYYPSTTYHTYDPYPTYGVRVVGPRYNPPGISRYIRDVRRPRVIWSSGFGYSCNMWGELTLNGRLIHSFRYSGDCSQALSDIQYYGDFCDYEDLYDQSGLLQAQFNYSSECRSALGWYY